MAWNWFAYAAVVYLTYKTLGVFVPSAKKKGKLILKDKTVVITGASSGIGRALAIKCHKAGAKVFLLARSVDKLKELANELNQSNGENKNRAEFRSFDVCDEVEGRKVIEEIGKIDILINNAGSSMRGSCAETPVEIHRKIMEVNFFGPVWTTQQTLQNFDDNGCIVTVSSVQGKVALPHRSSYSASKHAIEAYCNSLRAEYENLHVLIVSPGYVNTGFGSRALNKDGLATGIEDENQKKGMSPDECAKKIVDAIVTRQTDVIIGDQKAKFAVMLKYFAPAILNYVLYKRGVKDAHGRSSN